MFIKMFPKIFWRYLARFNTSQYYKIFLQNEYCAIFLFCTDDEGRHGTAQSKVELFSISNIYNSSMLNYLFANRISCASIALCWHNHVTQKSRKKPNNKILRLCSLPSPNIQCTRLLTPSFIHDLLWLKNQFHLVCFRPIF